MRKTYAEIAIRDEYNRVCRERTERHHQTIMDGVKGNPHIQETIIQAQHILDILTEQVRLHVPGVPHIFEDIRSRVYSQASTYCGDRSEPTGREAQLIQALKELSIARTNKQVDDIAAAYGILPPTE